EAPRDGGALLDLALGRAHGELRAATERARGLSEEVAQLACEAGAAEGTAAGLQAQRRRLWTALEEGFARTGKCRRGDACTFAHAPGKLLPWQCSEAPSPAETEHAEHGSEGASPAHGPPAPAELERQRAPHGAPVGLGRPLGDRPPGPAPAGGARAARAGGAAAAEGHRQADVPPLLRGEWGGGRGRLRNPLLFGAAALVQAHWA
ncbi:unnamed protein product, partial [Prorocentrum cordatum]